MKIPRIRTLILLVLVAGGFVLAVPYLLLGGAVAYGVGGEYLARSSFHSAAWQDSASVFSREPVRIRMVDDLLERHELNGMTRTEVVALLGEPNRTPYFPEWDMVYWLGPERGLLGIDSEWLVLRVDEGQRVVEHRIATD